MEAKLESFTIGTLAWFPHVDEAYVIGSLTAKEINGDELSLTFSLSNNQVIFAVTEQAYRQMIHQKINQSIIVSGESGAGKTQSARYVMRYFAVVDETPTGANLDAGSSIEDAVLSTNPIMELCAAAPAAERKEFGLAHWDQYHYLNQGKTGTVNGMDDVAEFAITQKGIKIFRICAALLHIGNIKIFENEEDGNADIDDEDDALKMASILLGLDSTQFKQWLIKSQMITRGETFIKNTNVNQAITARDSVAKYIYSMLFDWIVQIVNVKLDTVKLSKESRFIGVLDIYGFEHFQNNSFEQFCINYANEKLQQEFTRHMFRLEQEEYVSEKLNWSLIDFSDNQPCIDMIEKKLGILDVLDEESRMPNGKDSSLINKYYQIFANKDHLFFEKPRFGQSEFIIKHYACKVTYQIDGFIEKNKDTVTEEQMNTLNNSTFDFLKEVIAVDKSSNSSTDTNKVTKTNQSKKPTLGSIFKASLISLMDTIRQTNPHYIRCIKPNQSKAPFEFEPHNVLSQLEACGVLETIKISRAGYPSKMTYEQFAEDFKTLLHSSKWNTDAKTLTQDILKSAIQVPNRFELGLTKVFFRAGQLAFLEKIRSIKETAFAVLGQKNFKRNRDRKLFLKKRNAAILIQKTIRGYLARKLVKQMRRDAAIILIQKTFRRIITRRRFLKLRASAKKIQRLWRRYMYKRNQFKNNQTKAATKIQSVYRMYKTRKSFKRLRNATIAVQAAYRGRKARAQYKLMKAEARSVGKLKETNYRLENKLFEVSQSLDQKKQDYNEMLRKNTILEEQLNQWKEKFHGIEQLKNNLAVGTQDELAEARKKIQLLQEANSKLQKENELLQGMIKKRDDSIGIMRKDSKNDKTKLEEQSKNQKQESNTILALRKEISVLKDQLSRNTNNKRMPLVQRHTSPVLAENYSTLSRGSSIVKKASHPVMTAESPQAVDSPKSNPSLLQSSELSTELTQALIFNIRIPIPSIQFEANKKDILFPSHIIGFILTEFLTHNMIENVRETLNTCISAIQAAANKLEYDYITLFWISNLTELHGILRTIRLQLPRASINSNDESPSALLHSINNNLKIVLVDTYQSWITHLRQTLTAMIVPAMIESQDVPGYICTKYNAKPGQKTFDHLLAFLNTVLKTMHSSFIDDLSIAKVLTDLIRVIGVLSFNHLLMRRNFLTWKRGIQIQFNVTRLENWCNEISLNEANIYLEQLHQASKLLTMNKVTDADIDSIFSTCSSLTATQIKKLLSLYCAVEFDTAVPSQLIKKAGDRASAGGKLSSLLVDLDANALTLQPEAKSVRNIEKYIPEWIDLPIINGIIQSVEVDATNNAIRQQSTQVSLEGR
ncbi:Myosin type-2 heavy chain 1 [Globomyces sp. JEL0801]|nr:Myosin type-2 heavy chain 1 [Globomyces sp. JEL0801]